MTDNKEEYDEYYSIPVCPYCNHSDVINVKHSGFLSIEFDTYKCSKCSREFKSKEYLTVVPKDKTREIIQDALLGKINKKEMKEEFSKIGISIFTPYKRKIDFIEILENIKKVNNNKCKLVEVALDTHIRLLKEREKK